MSMQETVFVERDEHGIVKGVYRQQQAGHAEEELPADHPDVLDFFERIA